MSLRLLLASILWPWTARRALSEVAERTTAALDRLLEEKAPGRLAEIRRSEAPARGGLAGRRRAMAAAQDARVALLIEAMGAEEGIRLAREALFAAGVRLGEGARRRLGVREDPRDLVRAARVLYRVLGIRARVGWTGAGKACVRIDRCALAAVYSQETCLALSAADEGVVAGLLPGARLEFEERITEGKPACLARLDLSRRSR